MSRNNGLGDMLVEAMYSAERKRELSNQLALAKKKEKEKIEKGYIWVSEMVSGCPTMFLRKPAA